MGPAGDVALAVGAVALLNESVFAPAAGGPETLNWRIIPATLIFALLVDGLADINPELALGLAVTAMATAILAPMGKAGSPVANISKALGYQK
jgi:hypothetical protein